MTTIDIRERDFTWMDDVLAIRRECSDRHATLLVTPEQNQRIRTLIETQRRGHTLPAGKDIRWHDTTIRPVPG